jgi:methionyl-tRNA synthetase
VDAFRYFLMAEMALGQDASFTEEAFVRRYNADLANDLGNLLSRLVNMVGRYAGGAVPDPGEPGPEENVLREATLSASRAVLEALTSMRVDLGLAAVAAAVREANRYLERKQPWSLAKQADRRPLGTTLYSTAETLRIVSGLLHPVMPGKMTELRHALGLRDESESGFDGLRTWGGTRPGTPVGPAQVLFPKAAPSPPPAPAADAPVPSPEAAAIEYADFQKVRLRTARVLKAERVPGADKLLRLQIDLGSEQRQIVAGIAQHYAPEDLVGRWIVVVANLKPARIRGIESNGMLLAASHGSTLRLVVVDGELPPGSAVK